MEVVSHVIVIPFYSNYSFPFSLDHVALKNGAEFFGSGLDQIWLDNSICNGDESSLLDCNTNPIGQHNCNHSEGVTTHHAHMYKAAQFVSEVRFQGCEED